MRWSPGVSHHGLESIHESLCKYPTDRDLTYLKVSSKISVLVNSALAESPYHPEREANLRRLASPQPPELCKPPSC